MQHFTIDLQASDFLQSSVLQSSEWWKPQTIWHSLGISGGSDGKETACKAGDLGSNPGPGKSLGEGNGNPLQYSCLENSMDRRAWWATVHGVARSQTRLGELTLGTVLLWVFSVTISSPPLFSMNLVQRLVNLWGHPCLSLNKYFTFRIGYLQLGSSGKCNTWN